MRIVDIVLCALSVMYSVTLVAETCIECHHKHNQKLISDWQQSGHAKLACTVCHAETHKADEARKPITCSQCHDGSVENSYRSSKHGVIVRLEANKTDWSRPLSRGNYRAPSCAFCHMHSGNHNTASTTGNYDRAQMEVICSGCHSPRYVNAQLAAGERLKDIAALKIEEISSIALKAKTAGADQQAVQKIIIQSEQTGMKNIRLGSGHQSPDYQWWHGQPALDGMIIKMKGLYSEQFRLIE